MVKESFNYRALGKRLLIFSQTTPMTLPTLNLGVVRLIPLAGWESLAKKNIQKFMAPGELLWKIKPETRELVGNPPPTRVAGVAQHPQPANSHEKKTLMNHNLTPYTHSTPTKHHTTTPHNPTTQPHTTHTPKPKKCPQMRLLLPLKLLWTPSSINLPKKS